MAQNPPRTREYKDLQFWPNGVNSFGDPQLIRDDQVRWAVNAVNRGGLWQTRPGYKERLTMAEELGNHAQFFVLFTPTGGNTYAVFGISGAVYSARALSTSAFADPQLIPGLSFDPNAPQIIATPTIKSADLVNGRKVPTVPRAILMMQDGSSRAGFWDGMSAGHLNPQKLWTADADGNTVFAGGYNETRIGLYMAWSGNRLYVFLGPQGWASDLNDPLHFTDETVLTNVPVFNFPTPVTGAIDRGTSGVQQNLVFVFQGNRTEALRSGIQDRATWRLTDDFQRTVFAGVGCVAAKSAINHRGLLHWYSSDGVVTFDSLGTVVSTQSLPAIDYELAYSKRRICPDRAGICAGYRDSYVMWSVPVGPTVNSRIANRHTQVLDKSVLPAPPDSTSTVPLTLAAWQGVWTGINPVEWATAVIYKQTRVFALSVDDDGRVRLWEAFQGNRSDNGRQIPWTLETKTHPVTRSPFDESVFRYFRVLLEQVNGNLSVVGSYKGLRGQYHELLNTIVTAAPGSILLNTPAYRPFVNTTSSENFTKQARALVSKNSYDSGPGLCQSTDVEGNKKQQDAVDRAFSLLLQFEGVGALLAYRLATDVYVQDTEGGVMAEETGLHILPDADCPELIAGERQNFILADAPGTEALLPFVPRLPEEAYAAPTL